MGLLFLWQPLRYAFDLGESQSSLRYNLNHFFLKERRIMDRDIVVILGQCFFIQHFSFSFLAL